MAEKAQTESTAVVLAALAANVGIAVAKFVAAGISGSSSMLTEGVHSVVDSLNQLLLLYGQHRAKRPPDAIHPFGYARELYFWAFVVAILIFAVGAGVSVWEGYRHIVAPEPLESATLSYIVLGVSAALEGSSWLVAMRAFGRAKGSPEGIDGPAPLGSGKPALSAARPASLRASPARGSRLGDGGPGSRRRLSRRS